MHEAGLHVHANHHTKPDQVDAHLGGHRGQEWNDDEGDFEKIEKESQKEDEDVLLTFGYFIIVRLD